MSTVSEAWIPIRWLELLQPIGAFYVGVINAKDLVRISYSDVRRIETERREVETYLGIERPLNRKRVAELKDYVRTVDATFPSSIILAIESKDIRFEDESGQLFLRNNDTVAKVLDGQHRISGLDGYPDNFEVMVTLFVDIDIENQAMIFATINLEQTKVNRSLAYDLFEYAKKRSPHKTCHNIVRLLDGRKGSPFEGKIKILGTVKDPGETISQAVFVDALLPLISTAPGEDRDLLKRDKDPARATPSEEQSLIFRNMFLEERDAEIAKVLWNYFGAVEDRWGDYWRISRQGFVLNRTLGFGGLMRFLLNAYLELTNPGGIPSRQEFNGIFRRVTLEGHEIIPGTFRPGSTGQAEFWSLLREQTGL